MNEAEWLASEDPGAMLDYLRTGRADERQGASYPLSPCPVRVSDRKLRLFACGCCRLVWDRLTDPRSRKAVEVAERYADGLASEEEREAMAREAHDAYARSVPVYPPDMETLPNGRAVNAFAAAVNACWRDDQARAVLAQTREAGAPPAAQVALLRCVCGNPFRPVLLGRLTSCNVCFGHTADVREGCSHVPFRLTPTVLALAQAAYETGREVPCGRCEGKGKVRYADLEDEEPDCDCPDCTGTGRTSDGLLCDDRLAVLADALEEAGCAEEALLRHLRGQERCPECIRHGPQDPVKDEYASCGGTGWITLRGPHARGCRPLDLVLGKE